MASKIPPLRSKAAHYSKFFSERACTYYKELMEKNKQYIQDPPTVEACKKLSNQLFYTRLARIYINRLKEIHPVILLSTLIAYNPFHSNLGTQKGKEVDYVKQLAKKRQNLKTEDLGIAALFGLECYAWFCAGEIVGRGFTVTGYHV